MVEDQNTATELVTVDAYPTERLAAARGELWIAIGRMALMVAVATGAVGLFITGILPPLLDAHGGRWAWLAAGALAMGLLDDFLTAVGELASAIGWLLAVRRRAREVLSWPHEVRFQQVRTRRHDDHPAGLAIDDDSTPDARVLDLWVADRDLNERGPKGQS